MKNRYGDEYNFDKVNDKTYTLTGNLNWWRFGGKEGQSGVDMNDLGFVDPSGGPFISIGYKIEGRVVKHIRAEGEQIYLEVE